MQTVRVIKPFKRGEQVITAGSVIDVPADLLPKLAGYVVPLAKVVPLQPEHVTCAECRKFTPDKVNPPEGLGRCELGEVRPLPWPNAKRRCKDFAASAGQ